MNKKKTTEEFIKEAKLVHGDKYDYSSSTYEAGKLDIKIICLKHGEFKQRAKHHLDGTGCKKCSFEVVGENFQEGGWTDEEKNTLSELIKTTSLRKICKKMNKSMKTIVKMLNKLGLKQERKVRHKDYKEINGSFWRTVNHGAKIRNLEFKINQEYVWDLFVNQGRKCALTDWPISFLGKRERTASIDRINSDLGYIKGNIQIVHKHINKLKMAWPQNFLFDASKSIFLKCRDKEKRFRLEWHENQWQDCLTPKRILIKNDENYIPRNWDKEIKEFLET